MDFENTSRARVLNARTPVTTARVAYRRPGRARTLTRTTSSLPLKCRRKFLRYFPGGFKDPTYLEWERNYKWHAHERWTELLGRERLATLLKDGEHLAIARLATGIESRTNLLFSFEKMALRDAVKTEAGAVLFSEGLWDFLYGGGTDEARFERWLACVGALPRRPVLSGG